VAAIYSNFDYLPIVLTGIMQQVGISVSTDLAVAFKFTLPYLARKGQETSILIVTGPNVTVNTILGLPFIQQTRMVIDAANQVAELQVLDALPFPIDFRCAMCTVPAVASDSSPDSCTHTHAIRAVKMLKAYYANQGKPSTLLTSARFPGKCARKVAFVDHLPMQPTADKSATVISLGSTLEPDWL
jgi:hypothetical protein